MPDEEGAPLLDPTSFRGRLGTEVARVRRSGGFLSVLLIQARSFDRLPATERVLAEMRARLRGSIRLQDVAGERDAWTVGLIMPDTTLVEAKKAAERLLRIATAAEPLAPRLEAAAGLATTYGEVEGGEDALLAAAQDALREAPSGDVGLSRTFEGRPRILVVDDDLTFALALADAISERGWEGHACSQPEDARQRLLGASYHGLFIDLILPGTSGVDILRRSIEANPRRPAALMSGSDANHEAILQAMDFGPVVFIRKPLEPNDLDAALQMFRELLPGAKRWQDRPGSTPTR